MTDKLIDKPVPGVKTDARPHPAGKEGAMLSLQEVADRGWKARMSPRLRAWVTQQLDKCGVSRGTRVQKMRCAVDAFRKKVAYINDPLMGEFMATPDQILCLDEDGICILGFDCDEATITVIAMALCIGIPAMVIGCSFRPPLRTSRVASLRPIMPAAPVMRMCITPSYLWHRPARSGRCGADREIAPSTGRRPAGIQVRR